MKVAIMQPYFLPYQGYWQLFSEADVFVLFDVVKFQKRSWMPRNRILHPDPNEEFNYLKLPCVASSKSLILEVGVTVGDDWLEYVKGVLSVYRRMNALNLNLVEELFESWSASLETNFVDFIKLQIESLLPVLGLECQLLKASELDFDESKISAPGEWALEITKSIGADTYVNPCGGFEIFDDDLYAENGIDLKFLNPRLNSYPQGERGNFVPGLSIVDMLMFCEIDGLKRRLASDYVLLNKSQVSQQI